MSAKKVHLYVVGEGDTALQSMIERGLQELGHDYIQTPIVTECATLLDMLSNNELPIIIKPYNSG